VDPAALLTRLVDEIAAGDLTAARESAADLVEWLGRGGFRPPATGRSLEVLRTVEAGADLQTLLEVVDD